MLFICPSSVVYLCRDWGYQMRSHSVDHDMNRKRFVMEQIMDFLREVDVKDSPGKTMDLSVDLENSHD